MRTSGDTLLGSTYSYRPRPVGRQTTDSVISRFVTRDIERWPGVNDVRRSRLLQSAREVLYLPPTYPVVTNLMVDRDGRIWVKREAGYWEVFASTDGRFLARDQCTEEVRLMDAQGARVGGLTFDEFNLPYLLRLDMVEKS